MDGYSLFALGLLAAAIGIGMIGSARVSAISRNPDASNRMFTPGIIALALAEFVALLCFVIVVMLINK